MALSSAVIAGLVFGAGLGLAGMLNPAKVVGFLDIFGLWDPSLAFVMAGGILINAAGHFFLVRNRKPMFAPEFSLPVKTDIDRPLIVGSAVFGIGWGLAGLCPGPVVASLFLNPQNIIIFLILLMAGLKVGVMIRPRLQ